MNSKRYDRHIILKDFGPEAQQKLSEARVLVVGAGGLGVPVLTYLNAMGVGTLGIVDNDTVSLSNLHRQVLYSESDVGSSKVEKAIEKLKAQNSETIFEAYHTFLTKQNALEIIKDFDLVVDATDNFPTRYLINDVCVLLKKPFVYGALHGFEGQVSVFNYEGGPTYRCLFPNMPKADEVPNCNEHGVLGIVPGIVGNLQALEAVKAITGLGEPLSGVLLLFNGLANSFQKIRFSLDPENLGITELRESYEFECAIPMQSVQVDGFERLLEKRNLQIIDVRTPKEYREFHLKDSTNIPLVDLETRRKEIDMHRPVYFICQSGIRSQKAIIQIRKYAPKADLINVSGGINQLSMYAAKY